MPPPTNMYNSVWQVKVQKNSYSQMLFIYFDLKVNFIGTPGM